MKNPIKYIIMSLLVTVTLYGQTRYVSKQGSSVYPYTSWASAADSIQKAVDASNEGDSIIVGSGTYEETIILKRGNLLRGTHKDSCLIDSRSFLQQDIVLITMADVGVVENLTLLVSNVSKGVGIFGNSEGGNIIINNSKIINAGLGIVMDNAKVVITNCLIVECAFAVDIYTVDKYPAVILDNLFVNNETAISTSFPENLAIHNNIIITKDEYSDGINTPIADSFYCSNNLVIGDDCFYGIDITGGPGKLNNNVVIANSKIHPLFVPNNSSVFNNFISNSVNGYSFENGNTDEFQYNGYWDVAIPFKDGTPDTTNKELYPMFMNEGEEDYKLQKYSPLIDSGNPEIKDKDGTRSDIGLYGGPYGEEYAYLDLSPKIPVNISAEVIGGVVRIMWDRNYESDFDGYIIYRDTLKGFSPGENNKYSSADTAYFVDENIVGDKYYYKITSIDKQQNESEPGEEIEVIISGIDAGDVVYTEKYKLYQNYPNPFNPWTRIMYNIIERGRVIINIMNINGEEIATLVDKELSPGFYEEEINISEIGSRISSGVYIYRLMVIRGNEIVFKDSKKMIYLK